MANPDISPKLNNKTGVNGRRLIFGRPPKTDLSKKGLTENLGGCNRQVNISRRFMGYPVFCDSRFWMRLSSCLLVGNENTLPENIALPVKA
ncbi:hypothetical protein [Methylomonas koyamae]|uniref:hypothetical protein n=1 Tax=Methylomonas koyamae TaxID=702114 RepID=UPI0018D3249D|nr:hypothetical protein [Methylomonas koyamae]